MKVREIKRIGIGFLSLVLLGTMAWSQENTSLAMPLTREGGTARGMSMGSAVVGVPMGSASLFWNPAGLGNLGDCMEAGIHHNSGLGSSIHETAVVGVPLGAVGGLGVSLNYTNYGAFEGRDDAGNLIDDYSAGNMGASIGWGRQWFRGLFFGVAAKYNQQTLAGTLYSATAADIGLLWNPFTRMNLGVTYSNLGAKVSGIALDSGWRVGGSYLAADNLLLAAAGELKQGGLNRLQLGIESFVHPIVALRGGFIHNFTDSKLENFGLTAGLGLKIVKNMMFDYAFLPYGELGDSHRLSLTYKFLCPKKAVPVKEEPMALMAPEVINEPEVVILEKLIVLKDTHFEFDSAKLTANGAKVVASNVKILKDNPATRIRVAGYASAIGTTEYNQKLSERRAMAVKEILIKEGDIAPGRITTIGYGDTRPAMFEPIPENIDSKEARANMRVLFEIIVK